MRFIAGQELDDDLQDQQVVGLEVEEPVQQPDAQADEEDLQLCEDLDLGDPIEEFESDKGADFSQEQEKKKDLQEKCLLKKKKRPQDNSLVDGQTEEV